MRLSDVDFQSEKVFTVEHKFQHNTYTTATATLDGWTPVFGAGTMAVADRALTEEDPTILVITGTAVDDQYSALWRTLEEFKFHDDKPMRFRVDQPAGAADQNLDEQSCFIGCFEGADGANDLLDDGAGPVLDRDKFGFYKCGTTGAAVFTPNYWVCISSFGALQQVTQLTAANPNNVSGQPWKQHDAATIFRHKQSLIAEWITPSLVPGVGGVAPTLMDGRVNFYINGKHVCTHLMAGAFGITSATAEAMNFGYVTRMQAAQVAVNHLTYMKCQQLR